MRLAQLTLGLILLCALPLRAMEIEDRRVYPGSGAERIKILSTADLDVFDPFIVGFQAGRPEVSIDYTVVSSADAAAAIRAGAPYDLVISSAMDLQFQLANDGFASSYDSAATGQLPDWARWRDLVFAFTAEPAVTVVSESAFADIPLPTTRQELIALLRAQPERFRGRIGTYDVRRSGLGYLFATQEARSSDAYWRLSEVMGRLDPQLYCCSGQMLEDVASGRLVLAYNVLGSYASQRLEAAPNSGMQILELEDFATVMLRTALIPAKAQSKDVAGDFLDALLEEGMRATSPGRTLPPLVGARDDRQSFGPIRLGPALMVYLDPLKRKSFLESWVAALVQDGDG